MSSTSPTSDMLGNKTLFIRSNSSMLLTFIKIATIVYFHQSKVPKSEKTEPSLTTSFVINEVNDKLHYSITFQVSKNLVSFLLTYWIISVYKKFSNDRNVTILFKLVKLEKKAI